MARIRRRHSYGVELYYILSIVAIVVGVVFAFWGPGGYMEMRRAKEEEADRRSRVESLRGGNHELAIRIEQYRSDPAALEEYARRNGYARDGEIIQQLPQPRKDEGGKTPAAPKTPAGP